MTMYRTLEGCSARAVADVEMDCFERAVEWVEDYLEGGYGRFRTYLVTLENTVPRDVVLGSVAVSGSRKAYAQSRRTAELPYGYWSDLNVIPVRENGGRMEYLQNRSYILCASIPIVTVERRVLGILGEKHAIVYRDLSAELADAMRKLRRCDIRAQGYSYGPVDEREYRSFTYEAICSSGADGGRTRAAL